MADPSPKMIAAYEAAKIHLSSMSTYDERIKVVMNLLKYAIGMEAIRIKPREEPGHLEAWVELCEEAANMAMELPYRYIENTGLHVVPCGQCASCKAETPTN